MQIRIKY